MVNKLRGKDASLWKHGQTDSPTWRIWTGMMGRCYSPGHTVYKWYGGAGITVCPDWHDFMQFQAEMGNRPPGLTLERKDSNGPYCRENCRWATMVEQARNRTNNRHVTFGGETKVLAEWAELLEMPYKTLHRRLTVYHWAPERAFTEPVHYRGQNKEKVDG